MKQRLLAALTLLVPATFCVNLGVAQADWVAYNTTVVEVATAPDRNADEFSVKTQGGSGPCTNEAQPKNGIVFSAHEAPSPEAYKQAFSIALTALVAGKTVRIYNDGGTSCKGHYISVQK